jgi:hypothetical protein
MVTAFCGTRQPLFQHAADASAGVVRRLLEARIISNCLNPNTFTHVETLSDLAQRLPKLALKRNGKNRAEMATSLVAVSSYRAIELYADDIVWRRLARDLI